MRQLAAILLCGIFFFNWVGYRLLNDVLVEDATRRLDARLDQQEYNEDQLITIKVPLTSLAYFNNSAAFERSSGQIEINGIPCRYVKRRIYHDSLEMRCIPNQPALQLRQFGQQLFQWGNRYRASIRFEERFPSGCPQILPVGSIYRHRRSPPGRTDALRGRSAR